MDESEGSVVQGNEGVETKQSQIPASTPEWILTNVFFPRGRDKWAPRRFSAHESQESRR